MSVNPNEYLRRTIIPVRDTSTWNLAKMRQDNAAAEGRMPNFVGESYDHEVFRNAVGLFGEVVDMIWFHELYPGMDVKWLAFKEGEIHTQPDHFLGDPRRRHTINDAKTNEQLHPENFLILKPADLAGGTRDHWTFTHHYIEACEWLDKWKFRCPTMVTTGWCFGAEARVVPVSAFPVPGRINISQHDDVLKPMSELRRLIRLRERYGLTEGDERWKKGERI